MDNTITLDTQELLAINGGGTLPYTGGTYFGFKALTKGFVDGFAQGWEDITESIGSTMD